MSALDRVIEERDQREPGFAAAVEAELTEIRAFDDVKHAAHERYLAQPSSLVVLESLSRALPDDAWLESLILDKQRLTFSGHASNASRLLGLMEAVQVFERARFVGPIERQSKLMDDGEVIEVERFSMELVVLPGREIERDPNSVAEGPTLWP